MKQFEQFIFNGLIAVAFVTCFSSAAAQDKSSSIKALLENTAQHPTAEKVYVHTDKSYYVSGEILWMKVYIVHRNTNRPLALSKICYVELLDTVNKAVFQEKIAMNNATGSGSLFLSKSLNSGNYTLRAYTRLMTNLEPECFFEKKITIVNLNKLPGLSPVQSVSAGDFEIAFFPEGGHLVNGIENNVAFKIFSKKGSQTRFRGVLVSGNDTLKRFESSESTMGSFKLNPLSGRQYKAIMVTTEGAVFSSNLPEALEKGVAMQVTDLNNSYNVSITSSHDYKAFYAVIHSRGIIKSSQMHPSQNGTARFVLNKATLDEGVSAITIFDENGTPVSERLLFRYPTKDISLKISTPKTVFSNREKVEVEIASAALPQADSLLLSMSVFRIDSLQTLSPVDIRSYLLLASELKGKVENPSVYLSKNDDKARSAIDLLLLTQGWRRLNTKNILNRSQSGAVVPELQGHLVTGRVKNRENGQPVSGAVVYVSAPSLITVFKTAVSDSLGNFRADLQNYYGANRLIVQVPSGNYDIEVDDPFSKKFTQTLWPQLKHPSNHPSTVLQQHLSAEVQNTYNADMLQNLGLPGHADTAAFYQKPDVYYNLDKYTRFATIEETLREFVSLVDVRTRNKEVDLRVVNTFKKEYFPNAPLNLLDGVPVFNFARFFESDPFKMRSLDVVSQQYVLGNSVFDGVLNWKTYKPSLDNFKFDPGVLVLNYQSLQLEREFYSPVYEQPEQRSSHLPDFRNVLQWSPGIVSKGGYALTSFYTSDLPGRYAVIVEGLSTDGTPGVASTFFDVK